MFHQISSINCHKITSFLHNTRDYVVHNVRDYIDTHQRAILIVHTALSAGCFVVGITTQESPAVRATLVLLGSASLVTHATYRIFR